MATSPCCRPVLLRHNLPIYGNEAPPGPTRRQYPAPRRAHPDDVNRRRPGVRRMKTPCGIWCAPVSGQAANARFSRRLKTEPWAKVLWPEASTCATCGKPGFALTALPAGLRFAIAQLPSRKERPCWEQYFDLIKVQDAHDHRRCRDQNGSEPWACENCDCTARLESKLATLGDPLVKTLRAGV